MGQIKVGEMELYEVEQGYLEARRGVVDAYAELERWKRVLEEAIFEANGLVRDDLVSMDLEDREIGRILRSDIEELREGAGVLWGDKDMNSMVEDKLEWIKGVMECG